MLFRRILIRIEEFDGLSTVPAPGEPLGIRQSIEAFALATLEVETETPLTVYVQVTLVLLTAKVLV